MKVAIIGCGVMGSAFARQLALKGHEMILCDRNSSKTEELAREINGEYIEAPSEAASQAEILLLAIKPKDLGGLAAEIGNVKGKLLFSILTGVSLKDLTNTFPGATIVRAMPNLAITCKEGIIALVSDRALSEEMTAQVDSLLEGMGLVFWTIEEKIDAITALAGSGPAFVLVVIEAMVEAGIVMGLNAEEAMKLAGQTMLGSVGLLFAQEGHPGALKWQISSPGGTTIAGLKALEESGVRIGMMQAILAAHHKSQEMF
ncbi:MAG: Pyrroline-5-carboxylate reductase [Chlamydiae bacterium]|nr:Pyrroline-5-carboxylate reductase [Chlamydiota bacterium]